jgi:hypothetical protein
MSKLINRKSVIRLLLVVLFLALAITIIYTLKTKNPQPEQKLPPATTTIQDQSTTPTNPFPYKPPEIPYSRAYRIMLVGDSIIDSLGLNAQTLRQHLINYYPDNEFVNYNYGFGATSIETLQERLTKETEYNGQKYPSILSQDFDLIIIESFAYNPLSQEQENVGVEKHIKILDQSIREIIKSKPVSVVAIMTPIAPSKTHFAKGVYDLSVQERKQWAEERIMYIEGVIKYANDNQIPLIDVYQKSLNSENGGDLRYINPDDYIHPSAEGIDLISRIIAEYIFINKIFPD